MMKIASAVAVLLFAATVAEAQIRITEIHPTGSSAATYASDFFELTNFGTTTVDITGWRFDDGSTSFVSSAALLGVTEILPGQSVIFVESDGSNFNAFRTAWFGATPPAGFTIGNYSGSGLGLSSSGDAVNIFNSAGTNVASVTFGPASLGVTFDNPTGANGAVSALSTAGTNFAFVSPSGEVGSPGFAPVPEPALGLIVGAGLLALRCRRR
jgi:hypothetical protein